ncbi:SMI1/KNR4 family protein [Caballeronia novacaledonica]|uniref:SMI1/KNR4 family protein n=1 Tax=Caballeronia novacaledonica TaxID=1544861 RepID=UPI001EE37E53|nr:SMI1/KNR4 family protein [Caballeronia novacaledonica]GJH13034.1 SMI1/KNR4 family protein [Caballeronia novacaledonica]
MDEIWKRIETWLKQNAPEIRGDLSPGASDSAFVEASKAFGIDLPQEMVDSYRIHDGSRGGAGPLFGDWRLLSLAAAGRAWNTIVPVTDDEALDDVEDVAAPQIKGEWWNPRWLPFASNSSGDFLCVDLDPAESGTPGQIISYYHAEPRRELLATGFNQWLSNFAADLESGKYRVEDGWLTRT